MALTLDFIQKGLIQMARGGKQLKISNQKLNLGTPQANWKFSHRPGGWILAEQALPTGEMTRHRFFCTNAKGKLSIHLDGVHWHGEITAASHDVSKSTSSVDSELTAQFPGKVRKVLVQEGDQVKEETLLLLIEAMKMEFSIKAPVGGVVKKIFVKEGQPISPGDRLIELEATKP